VVRSRHRRSAVWSGLPPCDRRRSKAQPDGVHRTATVPSARRARGEIERFDHVPAGHLLDVLRHRPAWLRDEGEAFDLHRVVAVDDRLAAQRRSRPRCSTFPDKEPRDVAELGRIAEASVAGPTADQRLYLGLRAPGFLTVDAGARSEVFGGTRLSHSWWSLLSATRRSRRSCSRRPGIALRRCRGDQVALSEGTCARSQAASSQSCTAAGEDGRRQAVVHARHGDLGGLGQVPPPYVFVLGRTSARPVPCQNSQLCL
jgi:hypothetical protein